MRYGFSICILLGMAAVVVFLTRNQAEGLVQNGKPTIQVQVDTPVTDGKIFLQPATSKASVPDDSSPKWIGISPGSVAMSPGSYYFMLKRPELGFRVGMVAVGEETKTLSLK